MQGRALLGRRAGGLGRGDFLIAVGPIINSGRGILHTDWVHGTAAVVGMSKRRKSAHARVAAAAAAAAG